MKTFSAIKRFDILLPVKENIKFFFIISLLASFYPLRTLFSGFNLADFMGVLLGVGSAVTWAYIGCIAIYFTRRIYKPAATLVKILFYAIYLLLIITSHVITEGFGRYVSAVELQLISETNLKEVKGFFSTFATDPAVAIIFILAIFSIAAIVFIENIKSLKINYLNKRGG